MTDLKISELPELTSPTSSDVLPIVNGGVTQKISYQNLTIGKNAITISRNAGADYVCDGTADEVQFQAAIDYVSLLGGGDIYVRKGTYHFLTIANKNPAGYPNWACVSMASNVNVICEGGTKFILDTAVGDLPATGVIGVILFDTTSNAQFIGGEFDGTDMAYTAQARGFFLMYNAVNSKIKYVYAHDFTGSAVFHGATTGKENNKIIDCKFVGTGVGDVIGGNAVGLTVENNWLEQTLTNGSYVNVIGLNVWNNTRIVNNIVIGGISASAEAGPFYYGSIIGNTVKRINDVDGGGYIILNMPTGGTPLETKWMVVADNNVDGAILANGQYIVIADNVVSRGWTFGKGIYVWDANTVIITGNSVSGCYESGIYLGTNTYTTKKIICANNIIEDCNIQDATVAGGIILDWLEDSVVHDNTVRDTRTPKLHRYSLIEANCTNVIHYNNSLEAGLSGVISGNQELISLDNANRRVGINVTPTAQLHIAAGTAAANTAPIKIASGTVNTTPEAGAIESDGTHIYWVTDAGVRKQLD